MESIAMKHYDMKRDGRQLIQSIWIGTELIATRQYTMQRYGNQQIILGLKRTKTKLMDKNVKVFLWNVTGYYEYDEDGLEQHELQRENKICNVMGVEY